MKLLPIGIQDFGKLRELNALYVDKTRYIYNLYKGSGYYFLSRPRRFGKSLLVSTLQELFNGNKQLDKDDLLDKIKLWYNGYQWVEGLSLYNPFSTMSFLDQKRFANFWFQTGTPTFLIKLLAERMHFELENLEAGDDIFESYSLQNLEYRSLLFQTGYLTIKSITEEGLYVLDYPNKEVRDSMYRHLLGGFRCTSSLDTQPLLVQIKKSLEIHQIQNFVDHINTLFATIPYQIFIEKQEAFFHAVLHITFQALGMYVESEVSRAQGRLDTIVQTNEYIYITEFKLNESAEAALEQIKKRKYGSGYSDSHKKIIALGINFNSSKKAVENWLEVDYYHLIA